MKSERQIHNKSVVVGLTGQSGAGKSTVSALLASHGCHIIDADVVARQVVQKGKKCLLDLAVEFGIEILDGDGNLNRRKLGAIVFSDAEKRDRLNRITFPYIQAEIRDEIACCRLAGKTMIILDAPTLLESGSDSFCDKVVSVVAPEELRLRRLLERDLKYTREELESRIAAQHDDEFYISRSGFVIRNDGSMTHLRVQLMEMLEYCYPGMKLPEPEAQRE